jgi:hypothetical protein
MCASKIRENEKRIPAAEFAQESSAKKRPEKSARTKNKSAAAPSVLYRAEPIAWRK